MAKHIEARIDHLKCDNEICGYKQPIKIQDLGAWVGALCPDCGHILLTEEDYEMAQQLLEFVNFVDELAQSIDVDPMELGPRAKLKIGFKDGELDVGDIKYLDN